MRPIVIIGGALAALYLFSRRAAGAAASSSSDDDEHPMATSHTDSRAALATKAQGGFDYPINPVAPPQPNVYANLPGFQPVSAAPAYAAVIPAYAAQQFNAQTAVTQSGTVVKATSTSDPYGGYYQAGSPLAATSYEQAAQQQQQIQSLVTSLVRSPTTTSYFDSLYK